MSFFFFYQGYDSHDGADPKKRKRRVDQEEALLRYLLRESEKQPKLSRTIDKDSIRETLVKHFKGQESEKILELIAEPEIVTGKDLLKAYLKTTNTKRIHLLMALMMLDEEDQEYVH